MLFILVMLMTTSSGQMFQSHPKPMSEAECAQAIVAVKADLATKIPPEMKFELRCIPWGDK